MPKDLTIEDIKLAIQGESNFPMIYVNGYEDVDYKFLYQLCKDINPKTEDNMYSVSQSLKKVITSLRYMEDYDYENVVER